MKEKIVLIGAGSAMFTRGLVADLIRSGWDADLALVDIDPEALKVAEGLVRKMIDAKKSSIRLTATIDRRDVLRTATVVICTIGVGGRRAWEQDVFIPRKYGVYQPVGDSVMPGGGSRALRMIPAMTAIAEDVLDLAPGALFFNYSNPMGPICRAVRKATGAPVVGLCHGVFHAGRYLGGILGSAPNKLNYTAVGMNHLTWFIDLRVNRRDVMVQLKKIAGKKLNTFIPPADLGTHFAEAGTADGNKKAAIDNPFCWQLLDLFGAFPAPGDRHVTEFFPWFFSKKNGYYGKTLGVDAYSFEETIAYGDKIFSDMREQALSDKPLSEDFFDNLSGEHEQVIEIIGSIRDDARQVYSANLPNTGQVSDFPQNAIVESPAIATAEGLKPIRQEPLPISLVGTLTTRFEWVETIVEAALEGNRKKFIQGLILDGAVDSVETAKQLAEDLLTVHKEYLPQFNKKEREDYD